MPGLAANARSGLQFISTRRYHVAAVGAAYDSAVAVLERQKSGPVRVIKPAVVSSMLGQAHLRNGGFREALREFDQALLAAPDGPNAIFLRAYRIRSKGICHLQLGEIDAGLAAVQSAADIYRSPAIPAARRNLGWENLADLGYELWRAGRSALAIDFLREGISGLETGGAGPLGARYRIILAAILRQLGRTDEACGELPAEQAFSPARRRLLLAERARLHLATGHPGFAIADGRELVALWRAHTDAPALEIAAAEALLAEACLASGDIFEAETRATQALGVLGPWQHPDAASCLITIAFKHAEPNGEGDSARIDEAFRLIDSAPLLLPAQKARLKEAETARIRACGLRQAQDALPVAAA
jgi:tetratricopeptide (TPR) repeat protein